MEAYDLDAFFTAGHKTGGFRLGVSESEPTPKESAWKAGDSKPTPRESA